MRDPGNEVAFAFETTSILSLGCKPVPVQCREYENGLFALQKCCETLRKTPPCYSALRLHYFCWPRLVFANFIRITRIYYTDHKHSYLNIKFLVACESDLPIIGVQMDGYVTIIPLALVGYEMVDSQRGA